MRAPDSEVKAVLGPTNTGKTHLAIDRMVAHATGMMGFPLRLLARENFDRVRQMKGERAVALITGEERILPPHARYFLCTVEAMPLDRRVEFLAVDEIQLAADAERGHVFTDRLLYARGERETMFLGAETIAPLVRRLVPEAEIIRRPRFSRLSYAGRSKLLRLPPRSAVVAFSAAEVYALAELIRRQRGGAAVVLGALSPRTRNAQVALYEAGEVDFLVATDAIGMGLNMGIDHVAFAALSKFDGHDHRRLSPPEIAQIAGRAGRYLNDGTFGTTADVSEIDTEIVQAVENHRFDPLRALYWRNSELEFGSLDALKRSLERPPPEADLMRAPDTDDTRALAFLMRDPDIRRWASSPASIRLLWEVCGTPDFRKDMTDGHQRLLGRIYQFLLSPEGVIPADTIERALARLDRIDGPIDALVTRIAHTRTWTYLANRRGWLSDAEQWQERTRALEDKLSDALHLGLTERFIDRRAASLVRRLRERGSGLLTSVTGEGLVAVEGEAAGRIEGFRLVPLPTAAGSAVMLSAAERAARGAMAERVARLETAADARFALTAAGRITWDGAPVARLGAGPDLLRPAIEVDASDLLIGAQKERLRRRLADWLERMLRQRLSPLFALAEAPLAGSARGVAYQLVQGGGVAASADAAAQLAALRPSDRQALARHGVRLGALVIFMPVLLKPAANALRLLLWSALRGVPLPVGLPDGSRPAVVRLSKIATEAYAAAGYRVAGPLAVRVDILERLRQALRALRSLPAPVPGALCGLIGAKTAELAAVAEALGFLVTSEDGAPRVAARPEEQPWRRLAASARPGSRPRRPRREADSPFAALRRLRMPNSSG
ncbi:MAG: disulfide oxidoreductase [Alphaproteobacteria bacterium]|nr:disulfide oxidoreductase [Alphaproteobacteria bacterium]